MPPNANQLAGWGPAWLRKIVAYIGHRGLLPGGTLTLILAAVVGLLAGLGAALFTQVISSITGWTYGFASARLESNLWWNLGVIASPALGLLAVAWLTRRFAPEARGTGVPEVIAAVARHDGVIRPQVALLKTIASGITIGTGGSVGREGPIVQIGSSLGSTAGQIFRLSARNIKVLVAAGGAAGISATFSAPLAGVIFASEIILGSFAVESITPIVLASVIADVVQQHIGEHKTEAAFQQLDYNFTGAWGQLPSYVLLGLIAGLAAVGFVRLIYKTEDLVHAWLPGWWQRALLVGTLVGVAGILYPVAPPTTSVESTTDAAAGLRPLPPLMGVGYGVVDHALHLKPDRAPSLAAAEQSDLDVADLSDRAAAGLQQFGKLMRGEARADKTVYIARDQVGAELLWLVPLIFLKPLLTSLTLAGGGSGGVFAPSLFLGATMGGSFGLLMNLWLPAYAHSPGVYAIVGMGAVVAGTTQGLLSAILIVYEMTDQYEIILPIMTAAGLASVVARVVDPQSVYYKKLARRGENIARGQDMHNLDHIMVRDVMIRHFPTLAPEANAVEIVRVAREHPDIESLPVMGEDGKLIGIIRAEDLHRVLDSDISPSLVNAEDIALKTQLSVHPAENLIEAMRDFGARDVETLPVEVGVGESRRLVGLLLRADVIKRYRQEMLSRK